MDVRPSEEAMSAGRVRRFRTTFHTISFIFGLAYGTYPIYLFIYLNRELNRANSQNPLDSLLTVLAFTMLFEFVAEPVTGRFADLYGRRTAVVVAFLFVSVGFVIYACVSLVSSALLIVLLAIMAELVIAVGLAFHSGSLEAWFVDSVRGVWGWESASLENDLGWNIQAFTVGSVVGGVLGLFLATEWREAVGVAGPWVFASSLGMALAIYALVNMSEARRRVALADREEGVKTILANLVNLWLDRPVRWLIFVMSATYVSQIAFMYFVPLYVQSLFVVNRDAHDFTKYLPFLPAALFVPRFLGPLASNVLSRGLMRTPRVKVAWFGMGNALFLAAAGVVYFLPVGPGGLYVSFVCLMAAWFCWFASRPVQVAFLNDLVRDADNRAFANSMTIPLGAATVALMALFLIASQAIAGNQWFPAADAKGRQDAAQAAALTAQSSAIVFVVVGTFTAIVTAVNCARLPPSGGLVDAPANRGME
jgi:MFS family permease